MRTTVTFVLFAIVVIACAAPQQSDPLSNATAPPVAVQIELDAQLGERLALGLPLHLGLRTASTDVGSCTLAYDLWEERYRVSFSKTQVMNAPDSDAALRLCIDMDRVKRAAHGKRVATITVHEIEQKVLYAPTAYPEF
jgi:hypothetical protein